MYVCMYVYMHVCICMYACMCVCMYIHVCMCILVIAFLVAKCTSVEVYTPFTRQWGAAGFDFAHGIAIDPTGGLYVCGWTKYVCVCMYVYVWVCMYICIYVCNAVYVYICIYVYAYACMYVCMYVHMFVYMLCLHPYITIIVLLYA